MILREMSKNGFLFSNDKRKLDVTYIHRFLSEQSYWAQGIPLHFVELSIQNSLCFAVFYNEKQVAFARVITDSATFGYLADVFVDEAHRGKGLSKQLMEFILSFDDLKHLRRLILATKDAHSLYARFGFQPFKSPERFMEIHRPDIYKKIS
ncbi:MAG: GNAT family N-acetyltransferase [Bacteroidota bacterium]